MVFIGRTQQVNELRSKIRSCTEKQDAGRRRSKTRGAKEKRRWLWLWIIRQNSLLLFFSVIGENRRGCDWRMSSHTHTQIHNCVCYTLIRHTAASFQNVCLLPLRLHQHHHHHRRRRRRRPPTIPCKHTHTHNHTKENWACNLILCALLL